MQRIVNGIERVLRGVAGLCLAVLAALVLLQVVGRYIGGGVPVFAEEVARYAMVWMALLAASVGVREASHIRIDFIPDVLRTYAPALRHWLDALLDLISLTLFGVLCGYGVDLVQFSAGQTSSGLQWPLSYPYAVLPAAFAFAALFATMRLITRRSQEAA
jgi:TRAP-type transport system small permease protein